MQPLTLTFPTTGPLVALASANGRHYRYQVTRVGRGKWRVIVDTDRQMTDHLEFPTKVAARVYCRKHFARRLAMVSHPNRSKRDPQKSTVSKALAVILKDHLIYDRVDTKGRQNIRRTISTALFELYQDGHTVETLLADYKHAFHR